MTKAAKRSLLRRLPLGQTGGQLLIGRAGWLYWWIADIPLDVRVRVEHVEARWLLSHLSVVADELPFAQLPRKGVTARNLRDLPLGLLTTGLRVPAYQEALLTVSADKRAPDLSPGAMPSWEADELLADAQEVALPTTLLLAKPTGRAYPDEFYEQVASVYGLALLTEEQPARAIAEANDVPESVVFRWLREHKAREKRRLLASRAGRIQQADEKARASRRPPFLPEG